MKEAQCMTHSSYRHYSGGYDPHKHDFCQVMFGLQGCLKVDVGGLSALVDQAYGLIVPAGTIHSYSCDVAAQLLVIDTNSQESLDHVRPFKLPTRWKTTDDVVALLDTVARRSPRVSQRREVNPELLQQYVINTIHEDWPVKRMSEFYCLSVVHFQRRWKELTGKNPREWLRRIRLDEAQLLLRNGTELEVAAGKVGYGSASALCFALHRDLGVGARMISKG